MARVRIRVPDLWYGDYLALLGAARIGERRLLELLREFGPERLDAYAREWFDYSEQRMIAAIRRMPAGTVTSEGRHDPVPGAPDGVPVEGRRHRSTPTRPRSRSTCATTSDCQPCGLNLTEATARTAAMMGVFTGLGTVVPPNAGSFRRLTRAPARELHRRHPPAPDELLGRHHQPLRADRRPRRARDRPSSSDGIGLARDRQAPVGLDVGVISGNDPRPNGGPFVNQLMLAFTGGAGAPAADGWLTILGHRRGRLPLPRQRRDRRDEVPVRSCSSSGWYPTARARGGIAAPRASASSTARSARQMEVVWLSDGTENAPQGVRGGGNGATAVQKKRLADGTLDGRARHIRSRRRRARRDDPVALLRRRRVRPSRERDPKRVEKDVREGYVSRQRASEVYRVALDDTGAVDEAATQALRDA